MSSNIFHTVLATEIGIKATVGRPYLALLMIPALVLALIPFFRLHKSRRTSLKHLLPLFIHLVILAIATALITDIHIIETTTAPEATQIVVVADMSDSNSPMKPEMNEYISGVVNNADEATEVAVVVFADDNIYLVEFGDTKQDYLEVSGEAVKSGNTDIQGALEYAESLFDPLNPVNKRVLLLSDGRQTVGNAWAAAKKLSMKDVRLDAVHFDVTNDPDNAEVQLLSIKSSEIDERNANVSVSIAATATKATTGTVTLYEVPQGGGENVEVHSEKINLKKGGNTFSFEYMAEGAGIHSVYATIEVDDDTVEQNNTLYSWFNVASKASILLVDGDGHQTPNKIKSLIEGDYDYEVISTVDFPASMEALLEYDEVVLMNIDFEEMPQGSTDLIKRYVEEVGRGLVFTCGSNSYKNNALADNPLADILPVDLKIDERRETIATVITVDLSSSMGQEVAGQTNKYGEKMTRYDMVLDSVLALLETDEFTEEDYIGVVVFDTDATVALPITQLSEKDYMREYLQKSFEEYFYAHNIKEGEEAGHSNRVVVTSGQKDANGYKIVAYGTNYGNAISRAGLLLDESEADLKQMVFLSDGEPQDKETGGYDSMIRRMANKGVLTSTIGIGELNKNSIEELSTLATIGHGKFTKVTTTLDLTQSLLQIAETIKGDYKNERPTKLEKREDSKILVGLKTESFDTIGGYYGTTIKNGAKMVISADDLRPIIAEWDVGNGHTTVYMSDIGGVWSNSLFTSADEIDNKVIVKNLLVNSINTEIDSSGLKISSKRVEGKTRLTVETLKRIRDNEQLVVYVTDSYGTTTEHIYTQDNRVADTKYTKEIPTTDEAGTYLIEVRLETTGENPQLYDKANYAVVGFYADEYDLFKVDGKSILEDLSAAGDGDIMEDVKGFYDIAKDEFYQFEHNISTPALIVLLLLFLIDLFFRNFSPKKEKKKKIMTDEEQYESMRGR